MFVRVFKGRESSLCYTLSYRPNLTAVDGGKYFITKDLPNDHKSVEVSETELFPLLDTLFKAKYHEKENDQA